MLNKTEKQRIIDSEKFSYFISDEFDRTSLNATNQEIAEFAFGSVDDAINEFLKLQKSDK